MVLRKVTDRRLLHRLAPAAVILLTAAAGMSATGGSWRIAPLNPAFVAYARDRAAGILTATGAEERGLGYIPAPVDLSHLSGQRIFTADQLSLPASFDLRATGKLTPVKDQGNCGSCWAFATYASMESNLLPGETRDFSENNMKNTHGFDIPHDDGGNHFMSTAYLTRWSGPVDEADDPYNPSSGVSPPGLPVRKHVQEVIFLPDRSGPLDNDAIKQAVMTYGAVFTSMYYSSSYYNPATYSYRCSYAYNSNHAVAIVGWDDNYDRNKFTSVPAGDGAFIIKNSWGPTWGEGGYFYVSYYDATIGTNNALFLNAEPVTNFRRIYQYDPLGLVGNLGFDTDTAWMANIFTADGMGQLSAAGFYTAAINTSYELRIYTGVSPGQPTSGTLQSTQTGTIPMPGFHTVKLATPVPIVEGQRFSVVLKLATPGYSHPIPVETPVYGYSSQATANAGESYISTDGSVWSDLTSIHGNTNVCLKAYMDNQVATPEFSPDGGTYDTPQTVTISCATPDATIRYTTNGAEPTELDPIVVSGTAVQVNTSMILRARAFKDGWAPSVIKNAEFVIDSTIGTCPAPSISPGSGVYTSPQTVTLASLNNGAEIRYTLNGDEPTTAATLYQGPIVIDTPGTTLKAKVFKAGWQPSDTRSETYDFVTADPVIMPPGGLYHSAQSIVLSCATPGAEIRYTTDGSDPDVGSALYQDSILLTTAATVKARAFYAGWPMSDIVSATYDYKVATPTISPAGGTYSNQLSVKITCATPGAAIHYTTDGTEPSLTSPLYLSAFDIDASMTIKAKAFKEGWHESETSTNSYSFKVSAPMIYVSWSGDYPLEKEVELVCYTSGAIVHFTTDGSEPTTASPIYSGAFMVNRNTTIRTRAYKDGWTPSDIMTTSITFAPAFPVLTPINVTSNAAIHVKASCSTPGSELRYTLDGTEPSMTSPLYSGDIVINMSSLLKVKAFRTDWNPSATATGYYMINDDTVLPESLHPYTYNTDRTWIYRLSGSHRAVNVTFASACEVTPHEDMIYVMDGSGNNIAGSPYTGHALAGKTILVPGDTVMIQLKGTNSNGDYYGFKVTSIVDAQVAAPTSSLIGGTYSSSQAVTLTCTTPGAIIHYTTDGREPTESDPKVMSGGTLIIGRSTYLRAKAFKDGWLPSQTWCAEYIIIGTNGVVAAPDIIPNGGTMITPGMASISCVAPGAEIRYTTDGSEPIASSPVYIAPIPIEGTMTLKARAFKEGWTASPVVSATYRIVPGKYVNSSATGPVFDGSSWQNAYRTVQEAINNASAGSEIWVAAGIYNERITLKEGVALYGGFAGDEIIREQRDWQLNYTILDGSDLQERVVTAISGLTNAARLDGFVVRNSTGDGIYISGASPTIVNNHIYGNGTSYSGDGIYCSSPSAVIMENFICDNEDNGICVYGNTLIKNNYISNNRGEFGGGISCRSGSPQIIGNTVVWNRENSTVGGAGISCWGCSGPVLIANNLIGWNYTQDGAGISCDDSDAAIINNTIVGNSYNYGSGRGSGIFLDAYYGKNVLIANNIIAFNSAGIKVDTDAQIVATLRNNCVYGNNGYDYEDISIGIGDFSADPAFVDHDLDLHLLGTSPCLNRGDNGDIQTAWADLDGKPRLQGTTVDVGAYECSTVACPTPSPEGGAASGPISVIVNCLTPGASLHYSTNGDEPTTSDTSITNGASIIVNRTMVLKVKAYKDGWSPSVTSGAEYLITGTTGTVTAPVVDPPGGTYAREQTVTITCANIGAAIHYTLDGSDPTEASPLYQGPITISEDNTTLKARAFKPDWNPSTIISAVYNLTVAIPVFTPDGGTFNTEQSVTISCATPGAEIRYTSDGSEPTMASALYTGPVAITKTTTLKAKAFKPGMADSQTKSVVYELKVPSLTFSPAGGATYNTPQNVTISCPTTNTIIRYTIDGSEPTATSLIYSGPVSISMPTTLKAKAFKTGWVPSDTKSANYAFKPYAPYFSPSGGSYTSVQNVSIHCSTAGVTIRYTTDGSNPTASSAVYTAPVPVTQTTTLKARAFKDGWIDSDVASATYTMTVPTPIITPANGQSNVPQDVAISCALTGAEIRYTLDGSEPMASSTLYTGPICIAVSTMIKAKAFKAGWTESATRTGVFNIIDELPESGHPYQNGMDYTWIYTLSGNQGQLRVTFDEQTLLESCDYIYIMDRSGINVPGNPFNGNKLAGRTINVPGDTVRIRLVTDGSVVYYGFKVTSIEGDHVATPVISLASGVYSAWQSATLACATPVAVIHYTTDGRVPTPSDPSVATGSSIPITRSMILKTRAFKDGYLPSEVATAEYVLNEPNGTLAAPVFSTNGGSIISGIQVSITALPGATIRYTMGDSIPSESSPLYSEPIPVSTTTTIRARAFRAGWDPSPVATATFTLVDGKYVDADAPGPLHDGSSWQYAYLSVQEAIDAAVPGEEIWVASGRYIERITMKSGVKLYGGFAGNEIVREQRDWHTNRTIIDGNGSTAVTAPSNLTDTALDGFIVMNAGSNNTIVCQSAGVIISNNLILHNTGSPFYAIYCSGSAIIKNNTINGEEGAIYCYYSEPYIINNLIIGSLYGTGVYCRCSNAKIINNTIYRKEDGLVFFHSTAPIASNNIIVFNSYGIIATSSTPDLRNNCLYGNTDYFGTAPGINDILVDPLFINPLRGDFRLQPSSPCINAGNDEGVLPGWVDLDGNPRLLGEHVDIGAYECSTAAQPAFSPGGGFFTDSLTVMINCATPDAEIRFTTDGSEPNDTSPLYTGPVTIDPASTVTLKAKAFKSGWEPSPTATTIYYFKILPAPSFSLDGGVYHNDQTIAISCAMPGAVIRYTTDGSDPTESSAVYSEPLALSGTTVLKARAFMDEWEPSPVKSTSYSFVAADPYIDLAGGTYHNAQTATITCATSGAIIHYTTNGDDPTTASPVYSGPLTIDGTMTIKIRAFRTGYAPSAVVSADYHFAAAVPVISPSGGTYNNAQSVTITCATSGAAIHYTLDGVDPTVLSPAYTGPITIDGNATLKVRAFKACYTESAIRSAAFSFIAATPGISPDSGTYGAEQTVTLTCATAGATIYYTLDGSEPSMSSLRYDAPFALIPAVDITLKAKAFKDGYAASGTASVAYHFLIVATPCLSPDGGILTEGQTVSITCATPGATIHYTLDGSDPTITSPVYDGPIPVVGNVTLKAKAFKEGWIASEVASGAYGLLVAMPVFSPNGGTFINAQTITISCTTIGATIRYTLDGHEPTELSPEYDGPITIDASATLKARAFKAGYIESAVRSATFSFTAAAPAISPSGGTYNNAQTVTITCATIGASIRYTTNGHEPTLASAEYTEPLSIDGNTTLKAKAFKDGYDPSAAVSAVFTFTAADPVISPNGGTFSEPQTVTIGCGTAGAMVRYTIDGTDPAGTSPEYVGPFIVDAGATVKARAFKTGYAASGIAVAVFDFAAAAPAFSPGGGTYHAAQEVSLNCATAGAVIRYTTDGGEPTSTSDEYTGPITIDANTVLKAKAFRAGWTASPTVTASYIFKAPAPTVNPPGGTYNTPLAVTASCADAGAVIRYTTDGTEPTDSSPIHTGPIPVETAAFLKFKAFKSGWDAGETLAVNYTILSRRLSFQPGDGGAYSTLKTAQARRDDPYTQWQGTTLLLGRGVSGLPTDLWLWFPQLMGGNTGQVPGTGKIIQAKLVLRLAEIAGDPSRPYRLKIYRITDPDGRGAPAFGTADGLRTGLDFMYRDHRLGMNVRWADGAENILALFADTQPLDAIEFIPAELAAQGIDAIQLDVTAAVQAWMDGAPNQGWFVCLDGEWAAGQMLAFHGAAATVQALRPYLEVLYKPAGGDVEPPATAVGSFSAVTGPGSVALAWINPAADPDFSGVKIVRKPGIVPFDPYDGDLVYDGPGEACADSDLVDGKPYYYAAFAYDGLRNYGPKAWILAVPGTPAAPVLNAAAGAGYVQLTWNTVDGADRYRVYRRDGSGARLIKEVSAPSYDDFNLSMQPYDYWVAAVKDGCGEGQPSNIVTAAPAPASWTPAAPANLAAAAVSNTEIRLTWEDISDNEVAFALERKRDGEEIWLPIAAPAFNTQSFVDANLDPGTTYVYRLKAVSWDQESGWAESNPAATGNAPLAPANLTWTVISAGRVNLAWTDRAANETGYRVHVTGGDGSAWTLELPAEAEFCSVTGLRAGVAYRFRVEAWNLDGGSTVESETVMTALDPKDGLL